MPPDLAGKGNIEVFQFDSIPNTSASYNLWMAGEIEESTIPFVQLQAHLDNFPDETSKITDLVVFYIGFAHDKPPFDDARVRAAFSAAFDREAYIRDVVQGLGLPMRHFAPPGIFGAPPIDEVGVGFDPEFAAEKLAEAGYPNCEDFPVIKLISFSGDTTLAWIKFAQANWGKNLGCSPDILKIEQVINDEFWAATKRDAPIADRPHMWTLGWFPYYPDENNWVGDVLWCQGDTRTKRSCTDMDDLIVQAREESDPAVRVELYRQIEEGFFGQNGEFPIAPLRLRIRYIARHAWLSYIPAQFGGAQWYNWLVDEDLRIEMTQ
jgi:ABC-type transport system substrate-binding protein